MSAALQLGLPEETAHARATEMLISTPEAYAQASSEARNRFGDDPCIAKLTDSIAEHSAARGWSKRNVTVAL